jgi:hypothetical protein
MMLCHLHLLYINPVLVFYSFSYVGYGIGVALIEEFYNNFVDVIHEKFVTIYIISSVP